MYRQYLELYILDQYQLQFRYPELSCIAVPNCNAASSTEREVHLEDHIFMDFVEKYIVPPNLIHNSTQLQKTTSCSSLVSQEPESEGTDS